MARTGSTTKHVPGYTACNPANACFSKFHCASRQILRLSLLQVDTQGVARGYREHAWCCGHGPVKEARIHFGGFHHKAIPVLNVFILHEGPKSKDLRDVQHS